MNTIFEIKCPNCSSTNIEIPLNSMGLLYATEPINCYNCDLCFEASILARLGLWVSFMLIFLVGGNAAFLISYFGKSVYQYTVLLIIGTFFSAVIISILFEIYRPWFYVLSSGSNVRRKIINYGCVYSAIVIGIYTVISGDT